MNDTLGVKRKQIDQIEQQLTAENQQYFENLRSYLYTAGFFYEEQEVVDQVLQLAGDLQSAQANGETAKEFFGDDPKGMANQLIKGFKKESKFKQFKFSFWIIAISWLTFMLSAFGQGTGLQVNLLYAIIFIILTFVFVRLFFYWLHQTIYDGQSRLFNRIKNSKVWTGLIFGLIWTIVIFSLVGLHFWLPKTFTVTIAPPFDLILVGSLCVVVSIYIWRKMDRIFRPFLIMLWMPTLPGFLRQVPQLTGFFSGDRGVYLSLGFLLGGMVIFALAFVYQIKQATKESNE